MSALKALVERCGGELHGHYALLPGPGHSRRDRSLSVTIGREGQPVFHSFAGDPFEAVRDYLGLEARPGAAPRDPALQRKIQRATEKERQQREAERLDFCRAVWSDAVPARDTLVERYLRSRQITTLPSVIRFHPAAPLDYQRRHQAPAMVAVIQDRTGTPCGLHVTALKPDGSDKAGSNPRRMFGQVKGGAIRLAPMGDQLAVAEGIETALSYAALTGEPTWCCMSAAGLEAFEPPPGIEDLTIAADGDDPGMRAARALVERARRHCNVILNPAPDGQDFNDVLKESAR